MQHALLFMCQGDTGVGQAAQLLGVALDTLWQARHIPLHTSSAMKLLQASTGCSSSNPRRPTLPQFLPRQVTPVQLSHLVAQSQQY